MELPGADDHEKFVNLCQKPYKEQGVWFLNAFWGDLGETEGERLWGYVDKCSQLDLENKEEGCGLDEMMAHKFLEEFGETLTVRELRAKLRSVGAIGETERPKTVPLTHYLVFRYNYDWHILVNASQGDNQEELQKAQKMLDECNASLKVAETAAKNAKIAQDELKAAMAALHKEEEEYNGKIADAEKRSETGGVVSRNKAKAELAQLKAEDPLPLRRAKITTEAAIKKSEKTKKAAEETLADCQEKFKEAQAYLTKVKASCGSAQGGIW
eukprot:CAMPEP_0117035314 /NCGR_PEP_ID=MMETSP0472-20121206/25091_1 /TAXON_ID=693140 ORGANISM="Tiarina fusus, Strain LIS" /NCGR_SAMPLE_ID=MMETSP0472 /ASSEMBLY_ACC=CAM_ASM_000603 /LENGTH=269 /DNA_ID=CAMNT_0004744753 /DNA_START=14 /DNA_END=820 /DNA_ORIENTATION=+